MAWAEGDLLLSSSGPSPYHQPSPEQALGEAIPGAGAVWGHKAAGYVQQESCGYPLAPCIFVRVLKLCSKPLFTSPEASNTHPAASKHPKQGFIWSALLFENSPRLSLPVSVFSSWQLIPTGLHCLCFR